MRNGDPERTADQRPENGGHRVAVDEHQRLPRRSVQSLLQRTPAAQIRAKNRCEPTGNVAGHPQVAIPRAAAEPDVGLPETELLQERRNLLDLLAGRREQVVVASLLESQQHRGDLDQLTRRSEDDEDHVGGVTLTRWRASVTRARHIPAPCPTA